MLDKEISEHQVTKSMYLLQYKCICYKINVLKKNNVIGKKNNVFLTKSMYLFLSF